MVQESVKLDGTIDVNLDATNRTFKDMIQDLRCRDVSVDDNILIGEKIGDVEVNISYQEMYDVQIQSTWKGTEFRGYRIAMKPNHMTETFQPLALGYSYPAECYQDGNRKAEQLRSKTYPNPNKDATGNITVVVPRVKTSYINVNQPYPLMPYCNSRICYAHHAVDTEDGKSKGETSDEILKAKDRNPSIEEDKSPYWVLPADRPASGICFYVAYFLERLFKKLGVVYDMTALTDITDFNYLTFFNTSCYYDTKEIAGATLSSEEKINDWLTSRGCGGKINLNDNKPNEENFWVNGKRRLDLAAGSWESWIKTGDHGAPGEGANIVSTDGSIHIDFNNGGGGSQAVPGTQGYEIYENVFRYYSLSRSMTAKVFQMFANADNFPDATVSEVIESLENSFGVRFCYDADNNKVTVRLLRDMFRDQQPPIPFKGIVTKMVKMTEKTMGVRMKYAAESNAQEQSDNIRYGKRDYDTNYDYCDYPQDRTKFANYADITENVDVGNRNGYCDLETGDFFRIKVNSEASTVDELQPAVFEVGALRGVEIGDCSVEAENNGYIKDFISKFEPIIVNDVAYVGKNFDAVTYKPMLVPFIDEDMEHEFLIKKMLNPVSVRWGSIDIVYELCMAECYDPSKSDDGSSPLQNHNWGLTVGFLRAGNGGSGVIEYDENYDGFGNSRWRMESDEYAITTDTFDVLGRFLGTSPAGSFSLKPCAYKPFRYKYDDSTLLISTDPKQWEEEDGWLIPCVEDERDQQGNITARIRSRGMCDTWMKEFFHFLLNRQKYYVEALCTAAELADIPNKWLRRWEIDGKVGWINLTSYPIDVQKGIGKVELEFYAL
jgi:hypothetical protein